MDTLGGMVRTGVKLAGPASDLVELEDAKGLKHTSITFHRKFRDHPLLNAELVPILPFLEHPDVCDLLELVQHLPEAGAFIYPTGTVFALADAFEVLNKLGETGGVKAGLELCFHVAQILQDAYVKAEPHGIYHHGDLSPWRVVFKPDGQVRVIGFGLPQVDMLVAQESDRVTPKEDAYRYCPPERIEAEEEDFSSDLYSLALMAFELIVGEPLFDGGLSEIKQQATNAQGPYRLYQYRERVPDAVLELFSRCLKFDIDARHPDINEFIWEVRDLLALPEIDGPTLTDVAARVHGRIKRRRGAAAAVAEGDEGGPLLKKAGAEPEPELEEEQAQRWGRVSRSGARDARRSTAPAPEASPRASLRDRLRRSSSRSDAAAAPEDPKAALRDRLRRSRGREDGPPSRSAAKGSAKELRRSGTREDRGRSSEAGKAGAPDARPSRSSKPEPAPEPPPSTLGTSGRAASLLKRLRSSKGGADPGASVPKPDAQAAVGHRVSVRIDGADVVEVAAGDRDAVAEVVARALGRLGGLPVSLVGTVEAWPSVEVDGEPVGAEDLVAELGESPTLTVHLEPARLVRCRVTVDGSPERTLGSMVSTAVTAGAALGQILRLLELEGNGWHLCAGDRRLHPLQPLGEAVRGSDLSLVVRS